MDRELWIFGVPFMDSLSYVFLTYAGYAIARLALGGLKPAPEFTGSWGLTLLAATFIMTLDIIIDPVALRGYRWFLGQIYGYPEPGVYFGIPLSNFAGWWLMGAILTRLLQTLASSLPSRPPWNRGQRQYGWQPLLGPGLYGGIVAFNLTMTFAIGETLLAWTGVFICLPFFAWLVVQTLREVQGKAR
jgi:putative membrane protein